MARARKAKPATRAGKGKPAAASRAQKQVLKQAAVAPASGPLTLDEARVLVRSRARVRAVRQVAAPATPGSVARERRALEQVRRADLAQRTRDYKATMALLKKRGVRRPPASGGGRALRAVSGFAPLQILAEGDSWFDYPPFAFKGGIVPRLEARLGVPILNLAKAGDEVRYMLGVEERTRLSQQLTDGCPAGGPWDVLLFSGGGNDIVGNPMALWVRDWDPAAAPVDLIHAPRFAAALELVRAGYEDLIALRDRLSPATHLVFHSYDYAIPDGRGVCLNALGPWLKPTFDLRGFRSRAPAFAVVQAMLEQFARLLAGLAAAPNVTFIDAQGLLPQQTSWWHNELHPSQPGFDAHTERFRQELKTLFANRVI